MLPKFAQTLMRLQRIMVEILECPHGRVLDCLLTLSGHTYNMFSFTFTAETFFEDYLVPLAANELKLVKGLKSTATFNPVLVSLAIKLAASSLPKARKVARKITKYLWLNTAHPQVVCRELISYFPEICSKQ